MNLKSFPKHSTKNQGVLNYVWLTQSVILSIESKAYIHQTGCPRIVRFVVILSIESKRCPQLRMVWLTCEGETLADKEWLGSVNYTPWQVHIGNIISLSEIPFVTLEISSDHINYTTWQGPILKITFRTFFHDFFSGVPWLLLPLSQPGPLPLPDRFVNLFSLLSKCFSFSVDPVQTDHTRSSHSDQVRKFHCCSFSFEYLHQMSSLGQEHPPFKA